MVSCSITAIRLPLGYLIHIGSLWSRKSSVKTGIHGCRDIQQATDEKYVLRVVYNSYSGAGTGLKGLPVSIPGRNTYGTHSARWQIP